MSGPIIIEFSVDCDPTHAFNTWTGSIGRWWPADHTVSGDPKARAFLEPGVGGRLFERTPDGTEHDWGKIVRWDPPVTVSYTWHIGAGPVDATEVTVSFTPHRDSTTVRIEHSGWEDFGDDGLTRRAGNLAGWNGLLPHFAAACHSGNHSRPARGRK